MFGKAKKQYPENFRTMLGLSTMGWTETISNAFMTGLFMMYLTDYAGIGAFAAVLGTIMLTAGRIIDAVDDPLQGYIMDNARAGRHGKYKPFIILSTIMVTVAICCMFGLPASIASNPVLVVIWMVFFYLMYDMGISFFAETPLKQSLSTDPVVRSKITSLPRVITMIVVIPMSFFIPMLTSLNSGIGDMNKSFSILAGAFALLAGVISLIGIALVKEGTHIPQAKEDRIKIKEAVAMFKANKPWQISTLAAVFHGFVWTLVFATATYYLKWAYCTDLTTGVVDAARFGTLSMIFGIFQLFPALLAAAFSPRLVKLFNGPVKVYKLSMWLEAAGGLGLFLCMIFGLLSSTPALFFVFIVVILFGGGLSFVPGTMIGIECMDYGMYKSGKEMHAICNSVSRFISKAQTALSSALVGGILIAIGYQVNSVTDTFIGELSSIPTMLRSFIIVCGLVPAILSLISIFIMRFYPINTDVRNEMNEKLLELKESTRNEV